MLDIDHGTYPFVTSSSATRRRRVHRYGRRSHPHQRSDRRFQGIYHPRWRRPFPHRGTQWRRGSVRGRGNEFGAVTGRPRRCGWFDAPLLRYTAEINGFDQLVVTKLDVLDQFDEIPVCVAYQRNGRDIAGMPPTVAEMETIEPVYERVPGWRSSTFGIDSYDDLPARAKDYLAFLENRMGVEVGCISTGPERNQTIIRRGSRLEKLLS